MSSGPVSSGLPAQRGPPVSHSPAEPLLDDVDWFIRLGAFAGRTGLRCLAHVRVEGHVDDLPVTGPLIVASNHASNADGVLIGGWLTPALGRRIHWLGKREFVDFPLVGLLARRGSIHPVDRAGADVEAFRLAERILHEGHVLMVFPEGTRSPNGVLQEPKDGLALLALRTGAPILPVGVGDTDRFWPRGRLPRIGRWITLRIGEPFTVEAVLGGVALGNRRTAKGLATDAIMRRIAALVPERQRGAYGQLADEAATPEEGVSAHSVR
ncbi:MAG TPA: lysophospholipid acyltransferase family protein [Candidatus Limnocylindrales bacterium]